MWTQYLTQSLSYESWGKEVASRHIPVDLNVRMGKDRKREQR